MTDTVKVQFGEWACDLVPERYENGRIRLRLRDSDDGESVATATINVPEEPLAKDEVIVKDYSENEGMLDALVRAGVVEPTGRVCVSGLTQSPVCKLKIPL
jgi:hypothetical protein